MIGRFGASQCVGSPVAARKEGIFLPSAGRRGRRQRADSRIQIVAAFERHTPAKFPQIAIFRCCFRMLKWRLGKANISCCCRDGRRRLNADQVLLSITQPTRCFSQAKLAQRDACHHSVVGSWHLHKSTSTRMGFNLGAGHARQGLERYRTLHGHLTDARFSALRAPRTLLCC
jgi:hypothetical protein